MKSEMRSKVRFFARRELLRGWFEENHRSATELWIGYFKKGAEGTSVTYLEAVEEALCFGWIDGQVRSLDETRYANRYTPRRPGSRWSQSNVTKVGELSRAGRMHAAGLKIFAERDLREPGGYSSRNRPKELSPSLAREFRAVTGAWRFFQAQAPSYRRTVTFWVMSAHREDTRRRRLRALIDDSARGRRMDLLRPGARDRDR